MADQLPLTDAIRLSLLKWRYIREQDICGRKFKNYPEETKKLKSHCGFCERYDYQCQYCEFGLLAGDCTDNGSLYYNWQDALNCETNTQKILDAIDKIIETLESIEKSEMEVINE